MADQISMDHHLKIDRFQKVIHKATLILWDHLHIIDQIYINRRLISTRDRHKIVQISILQIQITHPINSSSSSIIPVQVADQADLVTDKTITRTIDH